MTLRISNPTGALPRAAEMVSTGTGSGYGTYSITIGTSLVDMDDNLVLGGLFVYDATQASHESHNEIEVNESSSWGATGPVVLDYTYYRDGPIGQSPVAVRVVRRPIPAAAVQTHSVRWERGRLTWRSWVGDDVTQQPFRTGSTVIDVPVPENERIHMNIWDFGAAGSRMPQFDVLIKDFSFVPLGLETATPV